jgi:hypothetical protein
MGSWGVRSYENDEAADALDRGFERVHGDAYDELMDDRNPLTPEQIEAKLASPETLAAGVEACRESVGLPWDEWDEVDRLGFVGVVVRHAELGVPVPDEWRDRAVDWLRDEPIEWDEATLRKLRRQKEIERLNGPPQGGSGGDG